MRVYGDGEEDGATVDEPVGDEGDWRVRREELLSRLERGPDEHSDLDGHQYTEGKELDGYAHW